jgi:DNA-binding NtrC family response regulator
MLRHLNGNAEHEPSLAVRTPAAASDHEKQSFYSSHPSLVAVARFAIRIAQIANARVLITGESGTGKSLLARQIHALSATRGSLVEVNCAAIPATLLESELFGHERGAFTDARARKAGLMEVARNGTLLLDEIGALPLDLQAKLLLFLDTQEIRRVGGTQRVRIPARVIAATSDDLAARVRERTFRLDLLYRLDVASIRMPALREMPEVIPDFATLFARDFLNQTQRQAPRITANSFARLGSYTWPGNVRELRNAVERALIFSDRDELLVEPPAPTTGIKAAPSVVLEPGLALREVERRYLAAALRDTRYGDVSRIARLLGISRKTLWEKRRRYKIGNDSDDAMMG